MSLRHVVIIHDIWIMYIRNEHSTDKWFNPIALNYNWWKLFLLSKLQCDDEFHLHSVTLSMHTISSWLSCTNRILWLDFICAWTWIIINNIFLDSPGAQWQWNGKVFFPSTESVHRKLWFNTSGKCALFTRQQSNWMKFLESWLPKNSFGKHRL